MMEFMESSLSLFYSRLGRSELPSASVSKRVRVQKLSDDNEFDLHRRNTFLYDRLRTKTCLDSF